MLALLLKEEEEQLRAKSELCRKLESALQTHLQTSQKFWSGPRNREDNNGALAGSQATYKEKGMIKSWDILAYGEPMTPLASNLIAQLVTSSVWEKIVGLNGIESFLLAGLKTSSPTSYVNTASPWIIAWKLEWIPREIGILSTALSDVMILTETSFHLCYVSYFAMPKPIMIFGFIHIFEVK